MTAHLIAPAQGFADSPVSLDDVLTNGEDVARRLLNSSRTLSYDPATEVDWDAPLDPHQYGLNPEWSTLYGTPMWDSMTEQQRVTLTRHEVASIMSTGIWFEMILQQMILRDQYTKEKASSEFQFALTEIADECRHSIMFARACETMGATGYAPYRLAIEAGRVFKGVAGGEQAYAAILVAEEVLDVMQRDWMRGENVLPLVRTTSKIHVVEESRHMKFARQEVREHMAEAGKAQRYFSGVVVSIAANIIVSNMVNKRVYAAAGLDTKEAVRQARANTHYSSMLRSSCSHLMEFLSDAGLLNKTSMAVYKRAGLA